MSKDDLKQRSSILSTETARWALVKNRIPSIVSSCDLRNFPLSIPFEEEFSGHSLFWKQNSRIWLDTASIAQENSSVSKVQSERLVALRHSLAFRKQAFCNSSPAVWSDRERNKDPSGNERTRAKNTRLGHKCPSRKFENRSSLVWAFQQRTRDSRHNFYLLLIIIHLSQHDRNQYAFVGHTHTLTRTVFAAAARLESGHGSRSHLQSCSPRAKMATKLRKCVEFESAEVLCHEGLISACFGKAGCTVAGKEVNVCLQCTVLRTECKSSPRFWDAGE